ncbi:MAG: hypothetical protein ACJ8F7_08180, partial [Gemmataceae bacterium]
MSRNGVAAVARSPNTASPDSDLRRRISKSVADGRFQNALDLAKQLFKYTPSADHRDLLLRCYLGRANQLREQGKSRDAATVLEVAGQYVGDDPAERIHFAEELARAGEAARAFQVLQSIPEPRPANRVPALAADAALARGAAGRGLLPEALHADFDRVRAAFVHAEAGQDDAAREALQPISLQSPFLEWKVLLRGLLAYYASGDGRALDNWSRLDPARLPARLAAPLRALIDKPFRHAQPPETQLALQRQADRLQGSSVLGGLKKIQHAFLQNQGMMPAFREAELVLPALRQQHPHLVPRLANCFYWEIVGQGEPPDLTRYQRLFGRPSDDPDFSRMRALAMESQSAYSFAHQEWKRFEEDIAKDAGRWPKPEADRARAMVWFRMGLNARKQDDVVRATDKLPPFPFGGFDRERPRRLNPSTEQCLRQAIKLAPDWLDPYVALFEHYRQDGAKRKNAVEVGRELLQRFPDHLPTLEALADLLREAGHFGESAAMLERAIHANPLNRRLRGHLGDVRRLHGAALTQQGQLDKARAEFESALALHEPRFHF